MKKTAAVMLIVSLFSFAAGFNLASKNNINPVNQVSSQKLDCPYLESRSQINNDADKKACPYSNKKSTTDYECPYLKNKEMKKDSKTKILKSV